MDNNQKTVTLLTLFTILNPKAATLNEALGISPERSKEIHDFVKDVVNKGAKIGDDSITSPLLAIQNNTDLNANEKVWATWAFGHGMGIGEDDDATSHQGFGEETNPFAEMLAEIEAGDIDDDGDERLVGDDD